jgi:uncharacterized protein
MISEDTVALSVGGGVTLEARLAAPPAATVGFIACHPHPLYGGDMDNPVVVRAVEVARALGCATLRFNFRGVGASTGAHGGGTAEQHDVLAALDHLRGVVSSDAIMIVAGYSFGAMVSAHVAARGAVDALALIAPPIGIGDYRELPLFPATLPVGIVVGSEDEYCSRAAIERLRVELPGARIDVVDGANHFFFGKLFPLGEALRSWLDATLAALRARQSRRSRGAG